jgi:hypothetical protein
MKLNLLTKVNKSLLIWLILIAVPFNMLAQEYDLLIGYGLGRFGNGMNNFKSEIYRFSEITYPALKNKMGTPSFFHGLDLGFMARMDESDRFYYTANWTNKHMISNGSGVDPNSGNDMDLSLKVRHNNLSLLGFGFRFKPWLGIAFSPVDFGNIKVLYKNSTEDKYKSYNHFYNVEKGFFSSYRVYGYSFYLDLMLKRFRFRATWYRGRGGTSLRDRNNITTAYHYNPNNLSFSVCYLIHLKKD